MTDRQTETGYTSSRRQFVLGGLTAGAVALAGCVGDDDDDEADEPETYEIWAADQGTHNIYVYEGEEGSDDFEHLETIDTYQDGDVGGLVPHMVHFTSDYEYAAVACTAGARTLVYDTEEKSLVGNIETGAGSHFAGFTPDDDAIIVDVIGESEIVRADADLENEEFDIDDRIEVDESIGGLTEEEGAPICHSWDQNGRSIHTLGPSYHDAGLLILDHDEFEVYEAFTGDEVPTNCGTMPHPDEEKFYLTAGLPSDPEEGVEGVGDYYVLDTADDAYDVSGPYSTEGIDAHGFWWTPDGEELWVLNRETNDGVIVDGDTDEVTEEIDSYIPGDNEKPDIMWASPDGEWMFVTSRGPEPQSAAHVAEGDTPGFAVLDIETRETVELIEPDPIDDYSQEELEDDETLTPDFHGIGVRPVGEFDGEVGTPPY